MSRPFRRFRQFFRELKRRNVYKVAVGYLVAAFVALQAADLLVPETTLPAGTETVVVYLAIVGFPIALVIAWAFELTPEGVRRTRETEAFDRETTSETVPADRPSVSPEASRWTSVRTGLWIPVAGIVLLGVVGLAVWLVVGSTRSEWAREEAIPRIQELLAEQQFADAYALIREAREELPDDPVLRDLAESASDPMTFRSRPSGASVSYKPYLQPHREWVTLGKTPLEDVRVPAEEIRWRARLTGHTPAKGSVDPRVRDVEAHLFPEDEAPAGMVHVPPGSQQVGTTEVHLPEFWIDEHEVTNQEYLRFVEDGGYQSPGLWEPEISPEEVANRFIDGTGRPSPSGWSLGSPPNGTEELPVTGVSWYEARAYCSWAGKSLPTVYHWRRAAGGSVEASILALSNFGSSSPAPVGSHEGISRYGAFDMAGNAAEWCSNATGELRYQQGGAWNEPTYLFQGYVAHSPDERGRTFGFRCARYPETPPEEAFSDIDEPRYDFAADEPVSDDDFSLLASHYTYDRGPLEPEEEEVEDAEHWRRETVSFEAGYDDERIRVHVFLPRSAEPPYQTVVYFPGSGALSVRSSENPSELSFVDFLPRTGRALVYPVYDRMYERTETAPLQGTTELRELIVHWRRDLGRTIDYLETRDDIDSEHIGFFGLSLGAMYAPNFLAVEDRIRVAVLVGGGLEPSFLDYPPEIYPLNFAPRVDIPVLMIAGRNDFLRPVETAQRPLFRQFGTREELRRLVILEGGHVPNWDPVIRETLDWLDHHFGPVSGG